jgi:anaerobic glycerol-3-phosphate dehydrogenase
MGVRPSGLRSWKDFHVTLYLYEVLSLPPSLFHLRFRNHCSYFALQRRSTLTGRSVESNEVATESSPP